MKEYELIESASLNDFAHSASKETVEKCGIKIFPVGGVNGLISFKIDILAFNRVVGLGIKEPIDEDIIDIILNKIEANQVNRFFIQIHPEVYSDKLRRLLELNTFSHYNNWVRLVRDASPASKIKTKLEIKTITKNTSKLFGEIVVKSFEWPDELAEWIASPIGRKNWYHYMVFEKNIPIATAAFFHTGSYAWFDFAATHPDHRGKGAQSALLARRIDDCRKLGVKTIIVETAEQTSKKESPSYRNVLNAGFKEAYKRPNFIFVKS
ncbi:MAG: GNAT family N-acetyltransferase [Ignavibacteriaceae bacterium]|jgi:GNAT superfamily N-acetyltransferase